MDILLCSTGKGTTHNLHTGPWPIEWGAMMLRLPLKTPEDPRDAREAARTRRAWEGSWGQTQPEEHAAGLTVKPVHPVSVGGHLEISFPNQQMAGPGRGGSAL